jgi:hypothetical protein
MDRRWAENDQPIGFFEHQTSFPSGGNEAMLRLADADRVLAILVALRRDSSCHLSKSSFP